MTADPTPPLPDRAEPSRPTFGALSYVANLAIFACERTTPFAAKDAQWLSDNLRELLDAWDAIQRGALEDGERYRALRDFCDDDYESRELRIVEDGTALGLGFSGWLSSGDELDDFVDRRLGLRAARRASVPEGEGK